MNEDKVDKCCRVLGSTEMNESPANIYLFKVNNRNTKKRCELCSKLTMNTLERLHVILVFLLLTLNIFTPFFSVSIVDFEQVNVSREHCQGMG